MPDFRDLTHGQIAVLGALKVHGDGDVWMAESSRVEHGVPRVNLATARALERRDLVVLTRMPEWDAWGAVSLTDVARRALPNGSADA